MPHRTIRVPKSIKVCEMREQLAKFVDYGPEDVLMLTFDIRYNTIFPQEIVYDDLQLARYINIYAYQAQNLYWERRPAEPYTHISDSNSAKARSKQESRIKLNIDLKKLLDNPDFADIVADSLNVVIDFDKSTTLRGLKNFLAEKFKIPLGKPFRLVRHYEQGIY